MNTLLAILMAIFLLSSGAFAEEKNNGSKPAGEKGPIKQEIGEKQLGKNISDVGIAQNAKLGPVVLVDGQAVYLKDVNDWEGDLLNQRVRVSGVLRSFDPPVAAKVNGAWSAGVSGPGKAYRLEEVKWERAANSAPSGFENRCGWLHNPTPANWWLTDKDGEWVIGAQGGYQVSDESYDHLPVFPKNGWKMTNGSYGYGCACLMVKVDRKEKRVMEIKSGRALALAQCRADKSLKSGDR